MFSPESGSRLRLNGPTCKSNGVVLRDNPIYILSIYDPTNYGNRLQACALEGAVAAMTGGKVLAIDGRRPTRKRGIAKVLADFRRHALDVKKTSSARLKKFEEFQSAHCATVVEIPEDEICAVDGPVVIGSDQCWNPEWGLGSCETGAQCAVGVEKKISYAASFGIRLDDISTEWRDRYAGWLPEIEHIGVRELAGAEIVGALTGHGAKVVLDPTMLQNAEWWSEREKRPVIPGVSLDDPYCLKYVLGDDGASVNIANRCAKEGLGLVDLTDMGLAVGPSEFVWLIRHSDLVCTDSFHATVFSLLFHRRFLVYERQGGSSSMGSRFDTLDAMFGINANRVEAGEFDEARAMAFDWAEFERRLELRRRDSAEWLENALSDL